MRNHPDDELCVKSDDRHLPEAETPQDFAKARAKNVVEEQAADIEDTEEVATLDSELGAP